MMCSDTEFFLRGRKLENLFGKLWIFAKRFERFLNFCKNEKQAGAELCQAQFKLRLALLAT